MRPRTRCSISDTVRLHATLGITLVLHTWTRKLEFHPHVHGLVTAGGLLEDQSGWKAASETYLFPIDAMRVVFRAKMLAAIAKLYESGRFASFDDFADPERFDRLMGRIAQKKWVVYAKKPFREVRHVLQYLGRYTHRVAISNGRLVDVTQTTVAFRTKEGKVTTLEPVEFLRRFVQHVLPDGFHKIRHYGLYSAAASKQVLEVARACLGLTTAHPPTSAVMSWIERLRALTGCDVSRCPRCHGPLARVPLARQQAPPSTRAA